MKLFFRALFAARMIFCGLPIIVLNAAADEAVAPAARATITINAYVIIAEVADTPALRRRGLAHRQSLAAAAGMLLVFPQAQEFCLWMRDVSFPLDALFIDAYSEVLSVARMLPQTTTLHCSPASARYALEVTGGWLDKHKVQTGDRVELNLPGKK